VGQAAWASVAKEAMQPHDPEDDLGSSFSFAMHARRRAEKRERRPGTHQQRAAVAGGGWGRGRCGSRRSGGASSGVLLLPNCSSQRRWLAAAFGPVSLAAAPVDLGGEKG
jgi:hypothetical protein